MFIKVGDPNPITIVDPVDQIDDETTRTSLKKVIKAIKEKVQKVIPTQIKKESETK
jgi:hypothetical protein